MSNKKPLLNENTIRRFMKLASIDPLTETFVDKIKETEAKEEELEEAGVSYVREDDLEGDLGGKLGGELEGELEPEEPGGEEPLGDALTDMMQGIAGVVDEVAERYDVDLSLDVEGGEEAELEVGEEPEGVEDIEDIEGVEGGEGVEELEETSTEEVNEPEPEELNEEDLLEKITQKVAARLTQAQKLNESATAAKELRETKINQLTDKIVEKIFTSIEK